MGWAADAIRVLSAILLVVLVYGMSATVDINHLKAQVHNTKAIVTGLLLQFIIIPLVGYLAVKLFDLDHATGVILLVVTSSPGGAYSNWWCSMFNADLALSVTMTAISTCLSVILLPINLLLYSNWAYGDDVTAALDWSGLIMALLMVIGAIAAGLLASYHYHSHDFNLSANRLGNYAGLILVVFSFLLSNSHENARMWNREAGFYFGVGLPSIIALLLTSVVTLLLKFPKPEVVTISVENCTKNLGIGMSVAIAMFQGEDLARGVAVPFYYGTIQALSTLIYCTVMWKIGWTKGMLSFVDCFFLFVGGRIRINTSPFF